MKNKNILKTLTICGLAVTLTACSNNVPTSSSASSSSTSTTQSSTSGSTSTGTSTSTTTTSTSTTNPGAELEAYKVESIGKLDTLLDQVRDLIHDEELILEIAEFYKTEKAKIEAITDIQSGKVVVQQVLEDTAAFIVVVSNKEIQKVKNITLAALEALKAKYIDTLSNEELKTILTSFYNTLVAKVNEDVTLENLVEKMESISSSAESGITGKINDFIDAGKEKLREYLDEKVNSLLDYVEDGDIKDAIEEFYSDGMDAIFAVDTVEELDALKATLEEETVEFVNNMTAAILSVGKDALIDQLNAIKNPIYEKIVDQDLIDSLDEFLETQIGKINGIDSLEDLKDLGASVLKDFEAFVKNIVSAQLVKYKNEALTLLDDKLDELLENQYVSKVLEELGIEELINDFKDDEIAKIQAVETLDDATALKDEIIGDCENFAKEILAAILANAKEKAKAELTDLKDEVVNLIPSDRIKNELDPFLTEQIEKIDDVDSLDDIDDVFASVIQDTKDFIKELIISEAKYLMQTYLNNIVEAQSKTPYAYLPEKMIPSNKLVSDPSTLEYDFDSFVDVSDIDYSGYGQQWNMVIDNITQLQSFASIFNVAQAAIADTTLLINEYLVNTEDEDMEKSFETEKLLAYIKLNDDNSFEYNISFKVSYDIPVFGTVQPVVNMHYDPENAESTILIKLTDDNQIKYVVSENKFICALSYGIESGSRTSYLSIEKDKEGTTGHVYEYVTLKDKDLVASAADFYIDDTYVAVVGNKADGIVGMDGFISELYLKSTGKMLGYEIEESISGVGYNTLWFNLDDISGIENIKIGDKTKDNTSSKSTNDVYLNNSDVLFKPTYNKKFGIPTSRKYDIEFRARYYYSKDDLNNVVEHKLSIPMMFIQEDNSIDTNFTDFPANILEDNGLTCSVILNQNHLNRILSDYDTLIPIFKENKSSMSSEAIVSFIVGE